MFERFGIRNLETGATERPEPPIAGASLLHPFPVAESVYYWAGSGDFDSVWRYSNGTSKVLLKEDGVSYIWFVTDGTDAAWIRATGPKDSYNNVFETAEVYTSKLEADPKKLVPKLVTAIPTGALVPLSIGDG
jgi:hypothetical protein